jgi:CheY-like chemotaxis protein
MDCQMPVMDGYTATREIRRQSSFADLPVIAMTANAMAGDREVALDAGMNDHITKPVNVDQMLLTMAKWIRPAPLPLDATTVGGQAARTDDDALPPLPGIDTAAGMRVAQQDLRLYHRLLRKFVSGYEGFEAQFLQQLESPDPQAPTRWAHTLKGVAGSIGAHEVQQAAAELERACEQGCDHLPALAQLRVALSPVLAGLAGLGQTVSPRAATLTQTEVETQLGQLRRLLEEDDTAALSLIEQLQDQVDDTALQRCLQAVAKPLEAYDFEAALEALSAMEQQAGELEG